MSDSILRWNCFFTDDETHAIDTRSRDGYVIEHIKDGEEWIYNVEQIEDNPARFVVIHSGRTSSLDESEREAWDFIDADMNAETR